ncbi:MAG TPA: dihydrofolate reductase [Steroidobacteraceae bacterium]|jgi:dihydrofolate reductase|nr:dihydrofolate reductase [Steroidobacteraceae bacterium]
MAAPDSNPPLGAPSVALVVAMAENGVIGRDGALPWHLPDDLKYFKVVTFGKPVLMGRRTFESIGKPLPGRRNLVMSRATPASAAGVEYVHSVGQARAMAAGAAELCVIGGAEVFALALPLATRIYLTRVHAVVAGDVYFPLRDFPGWRQSDPVVHAADARHAYAMSFVTLERC